MTVSDSEVFATAKIVIQQHGQSAAYYSAGRADELLEAGALAGAATWRKILAEIERLQAMKPEGGTH